mmetsp:Transcript_152482/g.266180  ORF Transcript_152482/g.266180 Transcript_152482/m.266180 type:complete len:227 (-) Transcript_152482:863-1543(-)
MWSFRSLSPYRKDSVSRVQCSCVWKVMTWSDASQSPLWWSFRKQRWSRRSYTASTHVSGSARHILSHCTALPAGLSAFCPVAQGRQFRSSATVSRCTVSSTRTIALAAATSVRFGAAVSLVLAKLKRRWRAAENTIGSGRVPRDPLQSDCSSPSSAATTRAKRPQATSMCSKVSTSARLELLTLSTMGSVVLADTAEGCNVIFSRIRGPSMVKFTGVSNGTAKSRS